MCYVLMPLNVYTLNHYGVNKVCFKISLKGKIKLII